MVQIRKNRKNLSAIDSSFFCFCLFFVVIAWKLFPPLYAHIWKNVSPTSEESLPNPQSCLAVSIKTQVFDQFPSPKDISMHFLPMCCTRSSFNVLWVSTECSFGAIKSTISQFEKKGIMPHKFHPSTWICFALSIGNTRCVSIARNSLVIFTSTLRTLCSDQEQSYNPLSWLRIRHLWRLLSLHILFSTRMAYASSKNQNVDLKQTK